MQCAGLTCEQRAAWLTEETRRCSMRGSRVSSKQAVKPTEEMQQNRADRSMKLKCKFNMCYIAV